jgi:hypothetical protein
VTTAKSSTSAPRTRLPSPSRAPSNKSSTTFAPRPRHNVALHQAHTAGTRRATSSHDSLQRSRSCTSTSLLSTREAKCLCAAKPGIAATRRAQETAACVVEGSTMVVYVDR